MPGTNEFNVHLSRKLHVAWAMQVRRNRYEPNVIKFINENLRSGDVFFDIGAHIGCYTLLASRLVQPTGSVYAFEPDPLARSFLQRNVAANRIDNAHILQYAVADLDGSAWLSTARLGGATSIVTRDETSREVETVSLEGFCKRMAVQPSVVKVDIEGGEAELVAGGFEELRKARIIILEFHTRQLTAKGVDPGAFLQGLFNLDKRIVLLEQRYGNGPAPGTELRSGDIITGNANLALL